MTPPLLLPRFRPPQRNFGRPVEYGLVQAQPWSAPVLTKLGAPVDVSGKPWPLGADGKPAAGP